MIYKPKIICGHNTYIKEYREDCTKCFLELLSKHVEFRNGTLILKNVKIE